MQTAFQRRWRMVRQLPPMIGAMVSVAAVAGLLVPALGVAGRQTWFPGAREVDVFAGSAFVLSGLALLAAHASARRVGRLLLVLLTGALLLMAVISAVLRWWPGVLPMLPRLPLVGGAGFALFAIGLVLTCRPTAGALQAGRFLAGLLCLLAFLGMVSQLFNAPFLSLASADVSAMSFLAALAFLALGLAVLARRPERGMTAMALRDSVPASLLRTLLPVGMALPPAIGLMAMLAYPDTLGFRAVLGITVGGSSVTLAIAVLALIVLLGDSERTLRIEHQALEALDAGVIVTDHQRPDEPVVYVNPAFERISGYTRAQVLGRNCRFLNAGVENEEGVIARLREAVEHEQACEVEVVNRRADGTAFWNALSLCPVRDDFGTTTHFVGVMEDITEERERADRLREALVDVAKARQSQTAFTRVMSHELRGSLNAASTWVSVLELEPDQVQRTRAVKAIRQAINDQARLISDLVDTANVSSPELELEREPVDLQALLSDLADEFEPRLQQQALTLERHLGNADARVLGDGTRLRQIFTNLLSNAAKYTGPGGRVTLELQLEADAVTVEVADTGIGLAAAEQALVFDAYWRADRSIRGLGLGLSIVRALVERHGGSIAVASEGPGRGSCFTVQLPRLQRGAARAAAAV